MTYRMTENRLKKVRPILESYRDKWIKAGAFHAHSFETEIKQQLDLHYKQVEDVLVDLLKNTRYELLILYYIQNRNGAHVVSELKPHLAKAYGVKSYDHHVTDEIRNLFWERFATPESRERGLDAND